MPPVSKPGSQQVGAGRALQGKKVLSETGGNIPSLTEPSDYSQNMTKPTKNMLETLFLAESFADNLDQRASGG